MESTYSSETYTLPYVKQIASGNLLYDAANSTRCSVTTKGGRWEGGLRVKGHYIYLWLIHVDVWQKPTQYCKAIILQLKLIIKKTPPVHLAVEVEF